MDKQECIPVVCVPPTFLSLGGWGGLATETPWKEHGTRDRDPPLEGTLDQAARQELTSYKDPPLRQTDTCKNITLPQTLFLGSNKKNYWEHSAKKPHNFAKFQLNEHTPDFFASMLKGLTYFCLLQAIPCEVEIPFYYHDFKYETVISLKLSCSTILVF